MFPSTSLGHSATALAALVVDDSPEMLRLVSSLLSLFGFKVKTAPSAEEAMLSNPQNFDLIISDLFMPGKSGLRWLNGVGPPILGAKF